MIGDNALYRAASEPWSASRSGFRQRPCIHTRNILICLLRFRINRRSTPSCKRSRRNRVKLPASVREAGFCAIGVSGREVAGDAAAEGAMERSAREEGSEESSEALRTPESVSVRTVVVS